MAKKKDDTRKYDEAASESVESALHREKSAHFVPAKAEKVGSSRLESKRSL
jgi:hypothetical protein